MIIALVGGRGMLGADIVTVAQREGAKTLVLDLPDFDICKNESLERELPKCDVVLNCAAFTRVDDAEKERESAFAVNASGAGNLARACARRGLPLVHISTDYVFSGKKGAPCTELDPVEPLNCYGESKLAGERAVQEAKGLWTIVRTQSLYGLHGRNFVKAILGQILQGKTELRVVNDQVSSPTYTLHLADALLRLLSRPAGLVHVAARGHCSWFEFAQAIVRQVGAGHVAIFPRPTAELKYPALRPAFSVLDTSRYTKLTGHSMAPWQEGLAAYLQDEPLAREVAKP